jgi:hypothetical protein
MPQVVAPGTAGDPLDPPTAVIVHQDSHGFSVVGSGGSAVATRLRAGGGRYPRPDGAGTNVLCHPLAVNLPGRFPTPLVTDCPASALVCKTPAVLPKRRGAVAAERRGPIKPPVCVRYTDQLRQPLVASDRRWSPSSQNVECGTVSFDDARYTL